MKLSDYVIQFLEEQGVENIFTVCGGGSVFLNDALGRSEKIQYIACHHEQAASMAAEAYARIKNQIGVCMVTSGPGGTNSVTGVAGAWTDNIPVLFISGQVFLNQTINNHPGLRTLGIQEINIVDIVKPITKYAHQVYHPNSIRYILEEAIYLATHGRPGPVWIDIPANIQNSEITLENLTSFYDHPFFDGRIHEKKFKEQVKEVADLIRNSERPIFHIGQGVRIAGAEKDFFNLIHHFEIPFLTARNANDIVSENKCNLYVGRPGTFAQRGANFAVQTSDAYIAIGTRLSLAQTGYNANDYARNAIKVQVDIDQSELEKDTVPINIKICADAKFFIQELHRQLEEQYNELPHWDDWIIQCIQWKKNYPAVLPEQRMQTKFVNSYHFIDILSDVLNEEDVIVTDMGFAFQCTHQAFKVKKGQRLITNCGLASMGWGLPAAVGAHTAHKGRVICIAGDGGLQMTIQEMATIFHHQMNVKLFVFNNQGYTTLKQTYELGFEGRLMGVNKESGLSFPDFGQIAKAYGFQYSVLSNHLGMHEFIRDVMSQDGPILCEIMLDPDQRQMPMAINRRNEDGSFNPTAIEDAWPFLDPKEIEEQLSVAWR